MMQNIVFVVIIVVAMVAVVLIVSLPDPRRARLVGLAEALVRYSAVAAVAVVTTALMYMAEAVAQPLVGLAVGDGTMVLAVWTMWTALSAVNGRTRIPPFIAAAAAVAATAVSFVVPEEVSTLVKLVLVAAGCLAMGMESLVGRVRRSSVYGTFVGVGFGYGGYVLVRVGVITFLGTDSVIYARAFDTVASAVVSGLGVIATGAGVVALYRQLTPRPSESTEPAMAVSIALQVLSHGRELTVYCMDVPDVGLIRRTHGVAAAEALRDGLVEAASGCFPSGIFAVSPQGDHLAIVEVERRGAASVAGDLTRAFDHAVERAGLVDLTEVDVTRHFVNDAAELKTLLEPLAVSRRRTAVGA